MKKIKFLKKVIITTLLLTICLLPLGVLTSCKKDDKKIKMYNINTQTIETLSLNQYLEGVVAGEMENNSPIEALKAQAVLARTFTLKFLEFGTSKYDGADISNDITEAQAYNPDYINDAIKQAVKETDGQVVKNAGQLIDAYFHANSGGHTADLKEGLNYQDEQPSFIKSTKSPETAENSNNFNWSCEISKDEILNALRNMGVTVSSINTFSCGDKGESGRCLNFIIGGKQVNANTFRLNVGGTLLKSTLIEKIEVSTSSVKFTGKGYGHGVGMSQEGAKILAKDGKNYKEIIDYYFNDIEIG